MPVANVGGGLSVMTVDEYDTVVEFNDSLTELDANVNVTSCEVCVLLGVVVGVGQTVTSDTVTVVNRGVAGLDCKGVAVAVIVIMVNQGCPVEGDAKEVGLTVTVTKVKLGVTVTKEGDGTMMVSSEWEV